MKHLLNEGDRVGLIACSDGKRIESEREIHLLIDQLAQMGLKTELSSSLYQINNTPYSGTPIERANNLVEFYRNKEIKAIFDISGGDTANQILPYVNFEEIIANPKPFVGISDLTVLLNAIFACGNQATFHYKVLNLIGNHSEAQKDLFKQLFFTPRVTLDAPANFPYHFVKGSRLNGVVIGGNIRCFLKLAGTKYLPRPENKILLLESHSGGSNKISSLFAQLEQIGYLDKINGILLGTFTEMEEKKHMPAIEDIALTYLSGRHIPIAKTHFVGHNPDSHGISIGTNLILERGRVQTLA